MTGVERSASCLALLLLAGLCTPGCATMLREGVTPFPARTPVVAPWQLNRELLMPGAGEIVFVVDIAQGPRPEKGALDDLVTLASRYGERPARWVIRGRPGSPRVAWAGRKLVWAQGLAPENSYVFVRYVGEELPKWGLAYAQKAAGKVVYVILVNQVQHRRWRSGLLPERRLEQQTLVHEYGHLLGLPPPDHGFFAAYPSYVDGAHCVNPNCALSKPRPRAILYGLWNTGLRGRYLDDYCEECQAAIRSAKLLWRGRSSAE